MAGAVFNQSQVIVILLDNGALGNTGVQPTGCTGENVLGHAVPRVNLEGLCASLGVSHIETVDPLDLGKTQEAIGRALKAPKPAVIVARQPCVLTRLKEERRKGIVPRTAVVDAEKCRSCRKCSELYCAAILHPEGAAAAQIRTDLCTACGMCCQVCESGAISLKEVRS